MIHLHSRLALRRFALQPVPLRIESLVRKQARRKPESVGNFFAWRRISQKLSRNRNGVYGKLCVPVAAEARREFSKHEKKANSRRETGTRDSLKRREKAPRPRYSPRKDTGVGVEARVIPAVTGVNYPATYREYFTALTVNLALTSDLLVRVNLRAVSVRARCAPLFRGPPFRSTGT